MSLHGGVVPALQQMFHSPGLLSLELQPCVFVGGLPPIPIWNTVRILPVKSRDNRH